MSDRLTPTPPEGTAPNLEPVDAIVSEVAALLGQQDNPLARQEAMACLHRAAARMNAAGIWLSARTVATWTYAASSPGETEFTDDAEVLSLPDDWAWPARGAKVYDEDGNVVKFPAWAPWFLFRSYTSRNTSSASGIPELLSIASPEDDEVHLWPPIDGDTVRRIEIPYFRRVAAFGSQDTLFLTPEMREALVAGGEYFVVKRKHRDNPAVVATFWRDFQEALRGARQAAARIDRVTDSGIIPMEVSRSWNLAGRPDTTYTVRI